MSYLDLRLCIIGFINMFKSHRGGIINWDLMISIWSNLFFFLLVLSVFSFVSIEVSFTLFTLSFHTFHLRLRFGNRPLFTILALMASLIFPQRVFWYVYPIVIVLLSFYPTTRLLDRALRSLQTVITINQVYDIFITTEAEAVHVLNDSTYFQQDQQSSETQDLEAQQVL